MILIITHKTDFTADFVVNKLNQREISYKRLNCEDIYKKNFEIKFNPDFTYSILDEKEFKSVWFRRTRLPLITGLSKEEQVYLLTETESLFKNIFSSLDANWVSAPSAVYEAENKVLQMKTARKLGFTIPPTIITNSREELKNFFKECNGDIILKPISQTKIHHNKAPAFIFTNPVPQQFIQDIEQYDLTPSIFQENVEKEYELRITVVGNDVFSAKVDSQKDPETKSDWRKMKLRFERAEVPIEVQNMCLGLIKELRLQFGAIDMIKTPDGNYVFLEINPNGQWAWIEDQTGHKISDSIIRQLTK
jgi:glutathione synthase/RimK-type ligase-like ATP-grasp enzyme